MTSPLAQFENARVLWCSPGVRTSGREGFTVTEGDAYLIRAFLKRRATPTMLTDRLEIPAVNGTELEFAGYCIRYAVLPADQVANYETVDLDTLTWDESATLPPGINRDSKAKMHMPGHKAIDVRFSDKAASYGEEGIGEILRGILGDKIYLVGGSIG